MTLYLCNCDQKSVKRIHWIAMSYVAQKKVRVKEVSRFEDLISEQVSSEDAIVLDPSTSSEFLVRNTMALLNATPHLIWVDSQVKDSIASLNLEMKSVLGA